MKLKLTSKAVSKTIGAAIALSVAAQSASAQLLEEVIVTAQKRAQSANDIGVSISAFSENQLDALGIQEATDVMAFTPGATLTTAGQGTPVYTIRGIGFDDYNANSSSTVGINVDEVALPYPIMTRVPQYDVERLEILKGPQGTLYGQNTTGGTINFIHNKADVEADTASVKLSVDSDSKFGLEGHINRAVSDTFATRLSFFAENGGEWQKNAAVGGEGQERGDVDKLALRLQTNWLASDTVNIQFKADYHKDESDNIVPQFKEILFINPDIDLLIDPTVTSFVRDSIVNGGLPNQNDPNSASWNPEGDTFGGFNPDGKFDRDNDGLLLSLRADWDLENMTLTSLTSFNDYARKEANAWDGTAIAGWDSYNDTEIEAWSQELRLTSTSDGPLQWIAGVYLAGDDLEENATGDGAITSASVYINPVNLGPAFGLPTSDLNGDGIVDVGDVQAAGLGFGLFSTRYEQETKTAGIFLHTEYEVSDSFGINFGVRYTDDERKMINSCTYDVDGSLAEFFNVAVFEGFASYQQGDCVTLNPATFASSPYNETISSTNVSGKLGLNWRPSDESLLYANISTGYKMGGFGAPAAASWDSLASYKEEEVTSYELGIKSSLADGAVQLNAAVYTYDYEDKQVSSFIIDPVFGSLTKIINAPDSTVSGAELELNWYATESTMFRFTTAYLDTEYDKFATYLFGQSTAANPNPIDLSGTRIQNTPEWQHNLMIHHDIDVNDSYSAFIGGDLAYSDEFNSLVGNDPLFKVDSYTVLNLRAGLVSADDRWQLAGWIKNVTDEDYYTAVSPSNDTNVKVLGRERTYGISFQYNWGM